MIKEKTIAKEMIIKGIGLHSGAETSVKLKAASPRTGILFKLGEEIIKVAADKVISTNLATKLGQGEKNLDLVEHFMAALWGLSIDNLLVEVEGPEMPVLDGSAKAWMNEINQVGIREQNQKRRHLVILKSLEIREEDKMIRIHPYPSLKIDLTIDFPHPLIGKQNYSFDSESNSFLDEIAPARTFGFIKDLEALQKEGLALGANLDNAIGLTEEGIINELTWPDEFVRHKILDALGDLYLSGFYIKAAFTAYKTGHEMNNMALRTIFSDSNNYTII
jgi:UDP-3-O-[3-hydroxymyristoyl] N-acetylglucosamine deacetylase